MSTAIVMLCCAAAAKAAWHLLHGHLPPLWLADALLVIACVASLWSACEVAARGWP